MRLKGVFILLSLFLAITGQTQTVDFNLQAGNAVEIAFDTIPGRYYQLQRSYNVDPPIWLNHGETFRATTTRSYGLVRSANYPLSIFQLVEYDLSNGLIAHYPFDGNANDISSNQNHGTVFGATLGTDRFGNQNSAYSFNGLNQFISSPAQTYLNLGASDFSISLWVSYSDNVTNQFLLGRSDGSFNANKWIVYYDYIPSQYSFHVNTTGGASSLSGKANWGFQSNNWLHLAITKSGTSYKTYLNGKLSGSSTGPSSVSATTSVLTLGMVENAGWLKGKLDDVRIYNRVLSEKEINILNKADNIQLEKSLLAHYRFDGNANDSTANANHGSVIGATLSQDRFGKPDGAYYFNGVDQLIQVPSQNYLNLSGSEYTVSFWAKFDGAASIKHILGKSAGSFNNDKWIVYYSSSPSKISMHVNKTAEGSFFPALATFTYDTTSWHYFTLTKVGTTYSTYIDGEMVGQGAGPSTITATTAPLTIGSAEGLSWFKGSLDDIRIYDRSLNPAEIRSLFDAQE
jgi:hypothetical protein